MLAGTGEEDDGAAPGHRRQQRKELAHPRIVADNGNDVPVSPEQLDLRRLSASKPEKTSGDPWPQLGATATAFARASLGHVEVGRRSRFSDNRRRPCFEKDVGSQVEPVRPRQMSRIPLETRRSHHSSGLRQPATTKGRSRGPRAEAEAGAAAPETREESDPGSGAWSDEESRREGRSPTPTRCAAATTAAASVSQRPQRPKPRATSRSRGRRGGARNTRGERSRSGAWSDEESRRGGTLSDTDPCAAATTAAAIVMPVARAKEPSAEPPPPVKRNEG